MREARRSGLGTTVGSSLAPKSCFSEILDGVLLRSTEELFGRSGVAVAVPVSEPALQVGDLHVGALIGFDGPQIRGSLMLICTFQVAARTRPSKLGGAAQLSSGVSRDWILIRDWTGELANQLVGRVKNRLLIFGIKFQIATPVALSGRGLALAVQRPANARTLAFGRGEECIRIVIDLAAEPPLTSTMPNAGAEEAAREGDVIEF
jgi:CheY-specific phosphatase CheX